MLDFSSGKSSCHVKAVLSAAQQAALIALPSADHDLRLHYTLSENDLAIVRSKRGPHNRLGFAIQLCYLRFPGQAMALEAEPSAELALLHFAKVLEIRFAGPLPYCR